MKITVPKPTEIEVDAIRVTVPFDEDHGEDEIPADFPGRRRFAKPDRHGHVGDLTLVLELDTANVRGWPAGRTESLFLKVRDEGVYELLSRDQVVARRDDCYVPSCIPNDYGDYFCLRVAADGSVWLHGDNRHPWEPDQLKVLDTFFPQPERRR